jgi:XTP/dITP diphosphohydrolase
VADRLVLLVTSPRLPVGLLTADAWDLVRSTPGYAAGESPLAAAVRAAGGTVTVLPGDAGEQAAAFREAARAGAAVWLAGSDGDPGFTRALGDRVTADGSAELEVVYGSWDPPGARLLDVVAVMDRLRSPGGCPWDAEQSHTSLMPYLLEEAYEAYDALADGDTTALREELGDVLLQVVFHARLAEEAGSAAPGTAAPGGIDGDVGGEGAGDVDGEEPWSIDDVAGDLVEKLVRRHPHVFAGHEVSTVDELHVNWDRIKREEKQRTSALDGVAQSQPALALVAKYLARVERAHVPVSGPSLPAGVVAPGDDEALGELLFALVVAGRERGLDAEAALRRAAHAYAARVRAAESDRGT